MLNEEAKVKRNRSNIINIQIAFIAWLLELMAGIVCWITYLIDSKVASRWLGISDMALNFIFIPLSYVLNNDVNKAVIVGNGWIQGLGSLLRKDSEVAQEHMIKEDKHRNNTSKISGSDTSISNNSNKSRIQNNPANHTTSQAKMPNESCDDHAGAIQSHADDKAHSNPKLISVTVQVHSVKELENKICETRQGNVTIADSYSYESPSKMDLHPVKVSTEKKHEMESITQDDTNVLKSQNRSSNSSRCVSRISQMGLGLDVDNFEIC